MKYIFSMLSLLLLVGCFEQEVKKEPTQEEIRAAATKKFLQINDDVRKIADECRGEGSIIVNPLKAMKCTSVCSFDPQNCEKVPEIEVTDFKKLACVEAVGQAGWVCDYSYTVTSESDFILGMFENIYGKNNQTQGRFLQTENNEWIMVPMQ